MTSPRSVVMNCCRPGRVEPACRAQIEKWELRMTRCHLLNGAGQSAVDASAWCCVASRVGGGWLALSHSITSHQLLLLLLLLPLLHNAW